VVSAPKLPTETKMREHPSVFRDFWRNPYLNGRVLFRVRVGHPFFL